MAFFNEKWNRSSVLTKVALCTMLLNSLLLLISGLVLLSWEKALEINAGYYFIFLVMFFYNALLSFGIFKVNGVARVFTILEGLASVLAIVFFIAGYKYVVSYTQEAATALYGESVVELATTTASASAGLIGSLLKGILPALLALIPPSVIATIGIYLVLFIGPYPLQMLSMLILFISGKDFKKIRREEQK
ncbi:hypothetical protein FACS189493_5480 [Spirochaetia bacterium]|nr:hypothetical protein FACS189493_5480 [Spirochaetia bacterium]